MGTQKRLRTTLYINLFFLDFLLYIKLILRETPEIKLILESWKQSCKLRKSNFSAIKYKQPRNQAEEQLQYMQILQKHSEHCGKACRCNLRCHLKTSHRSLLESVVIWDIKRVLEPEPRGHSGWGRGRPSRGSLSPVSDVGVRIFCSALHTIWPCLLPKTQLLCFFHVWSTNGAGWSLILSAKSLNKLLTVQATVNKLQESEILTCACIVPSTLCTIILKACLSIWEKKHIQHCIPAFSSSLKPFFHDATLTQTHTHSQCVFNLKSQSVQNVHNPLQILFWRAETETRNKSHVLLWCLGPNAQRTWTLSAWRTRQKKMACLTSTKRQSFCLITTHCSQNWPAKLFGWKPK